MGGGDDGPEIPTAPDFNAVITQPSAPPADLYRAIGDPMVDRREEAKRAMVPRAGTPIPETLARLMSTSWRLARETQEL